MRACYNMPIIPIAYIYRKVKRPFGTLLSVAAIGGVVGQGDKCEP
jgi:hypothetical protein